MECEMNNIDKIRAARKLSIKQMPVSIRPLYSRGLGLKSGQLVKAKCQECICYEDVKNGILGCKGFSCPLYFQRPYRYKDTSRVQAIIRGEEIAKKGSKKDTNFKD